MLSAKVLAIVFLLGILLFSHFSPSLSEVEQLNKSLAFKSGYFQNEPFPLAVIIGSIYPNQLLYSFSLHRLIPVSLAIIAVALFPESVWGIIMLVISPWFIKSALFDTTSILTLVLALALIKARQQHWGYLIPALIFLLSFTSLAGLVFALVCLAIILFDQNRINRALGVLSILVLVLSLSLFGRSHLIARDIFAAVDNYGQERASFDVNMRLHDETVINNYQDVIPLTVKRLAYNKLFFQYLNAVPNVFNSLNFDKLFSPSQQGVTVARNLWGETGFISLFFWEMGLLILGVCTWRTIAKVIRITIIMTLVAGLLGASLYPSANFELGGIVALIGLSLLAGQGFVLISKNKLVLLPTALLVVVSIGSTYYYFLAKELTWRDNRPYVMTLMATEAKKYLNSKVVVSGMVGPSDSYWHWTTHQDSRSFSNIRFDNFNFAADNCFGPGIYIGLPGQFVGNKTKINSNNFSISELPNYMHLLSSYNFEKHVSYGNGDQIWIVQIN